jgi:hypothetical protein
MMVATLGGGRIMESTPWMGEELEVEDLMERLEPYVAKGDL